MPQEFRLPDVSAYTTTSYHETLEYGGGGIQRRIIGQRLSPTAGAASRLFAEAIPANSKPLYYAIVCRSAPGALVTATKVGIGSAADPDLFAELTFTTIDTTSDPPVIGEPDTATFITTAVTVGLHSVDNSGNAAGTFNATTAGTWDVYVIYETVARPPLA